MLILFWIQKHVVSYAVDDSNIRFPGSIFIKLDKKVSQRIRNNISFEFCVIFKVFREENCQSMKDAFQALEKNEKDVKIRSLHYRNGRL